MDGRSLISQTAIFDPLGLAGQSLAHRVECTGANALFEVSVLQLIAQLDRVGVAVLDGLADRLVDPLQRLARGPCVSILGVEGVACVEGVARIDG